MMTVQHAFEPIIQAEHVWHGAHALPSNGCVRYAFSERLSSVAG